jgi:hypothetical protein
MCAGTGSGVAPTIADYNSELSKMRLETQEMSQIGSRVFA